MPPKASTSAKGGQGKGKLSPIEQQLLDVGSQAPNRVSLYTFLFTLRGFSLSTNRERVNASRRSDRLNYSQNVV